MTETFGSRWHKPVLIGSWVAVLVGTPLAWFVALLVAANAWLYLVPKNPCDSECWNNGLYQQLGGWIGMALASLLVALGPATAFLLLRKHILAGWILGFGFVMATAGWWLWADHLFTLASANFGG